MENNCCINCVWYSSEKCTCKIDSKKVEPTHSCIEFSLNKLNFINSKN